MRRIALFLLLATACTLPRPDVRDAMNAWMKALNALDEPGITGAFAVDATAFFPVVKAERVNDGAGIAEVFRQYVAGSKTTNIVPEDLHVQEHGDTAVVTFNVHNPSAVSRRTFVWRYANGAWKIVHMHASNTPIR